MKFEESEKLISDLADLYAKEKYSFELFKNGIVDYFNLEPSLKEVVHSVKSRLKDPDHLKEKIRRKMAGGDRRIDENNFFDEITDLVGVRVLHLYQDQLIRIHDKITEKVTNGDWYFEEKPVAYSWDPESKDFFESLGLEVKLRDTYYTSIHYLVRPKKKSNVCCEIQVRTLFEEIWGEIDHTINYPQQTQKKACKEQLRVLSKLVSTGSRLADSIFRTHNDDG